MGSKRGKKDPLRALQFRLENNSNLEISSFILFSGGNLTFLVVRGAGHMVPISQPVTARQILKDFMSSIHTDFKGSVYKPVVVERGVQCEA